MLNSSKVSNNVNIYDEEEKCKREKCNSRNRSVLPQSELLKFL